jgi:sugar O-acyltransferase (sialic acid O-acetyltransferase NeuD family)
MKSVVIVGAAQFAKRMCVYLTHDAGRRVAAFAVEREYLQERSLLERPVVALDEVVDRYPPGEHDACVAVGHWGVNTLRERLCAEVEALGYDLVSYVSSTATCWPDSQIGSRHVLVLDRAVVAPFASVGDNVILNGCNINHDVTVGDNCFVATGATLGGGAALGDYGFVGLGAVVFSGVKVAPRCVIGAGAVIKRDTEEGEVYSAQASAPIRRRSWELRDPF